MSPELLPTGTTGINIDIRDDDSHLADAVEMERLGYDTLWIAGGQLDRLERVTDLLAATSSVRIATGIVPLGVYETPAIAALHHELAARVPGRFVLGLGGPQQPRPLGPLRAYLDELDEAGVSSDERLLAALGPRKITIAQQRSAGAILLLVTPEFTAEVRTELGDGPTLVVQQLVVLDEDGERARAAARGTIGFLTQVPGYRASLQRMGCAESDLDELSDELVDAVTAWGDGSAIAERVAAHRAAGADHVALSVLGADDGPGLVGAARVLAPQQLG